MELVVASAYFPGDSPEGPPPPEVRALINFCLDKNISYIVGCDANAHHTSWGSTDTNRRGTSLYNFLIDVGACVLNEGNSPTFYSNGREEVLDITFCSPELINDIKNWHVSDNPSLSDHTHILFECNCTSVTQPSRPNPRKTDWRIFKDKVDLGLNFLPHNISNKWELHHFKDLMRIVKHHLRQPKICTEHLRILKDHLRQLFARVYKSE